MFNRAFALGESDEEITSRPDWSMLPPHIRTGYMNARTRYWTPAAAAERTEARRKRYVDVRNKLVKAIADSGGKILASSDSPEWLHAYGWALHREIESFVTAGLTPYQALATATRHPAEFLGASAEWGTITLGKRADFVLLSANPLEDIRNTQRIEAVSIGGRWLDRATLDAMIRRGTQAINGAHRRRDSRTVPIGDASSARRVVVPDRFARPASFWRFRMPRAPAVVFGLVLAAMVHVDWHLARPLHHRLSLGLLYHWVITATVFGVVGCVLARFWPRHRWTLGATVFVAALVIAQGIEPMLEALIYDGRFGYEVEPERWAAFWRSVLVAGRPCMRRRSGCVLRGLSFCPPATPTGDM